MKIEEKKEKNKKLGSLVAGKLSSSSGFTLVEIIVATAIFTVTMLITIGALLSLNDSSRKAQALRTVIDNLNFAVEDMNRKIRTGDAYYCYPDGSVPNQVLTSPATANCPSAGGKAISLKTQDRDVLGRDIWVAYRFEPGGNGVGGSIKQKRSSELGGTNLEQDWSVITAPEVDVKRMEFRVIGVDAARKTQPMVIVNISGVVDLKKEKLRTNFSLQTAISRRGIE